MLAVPGPLAKETRVLGPVVLVQSTLTMNGGVRPAALKEYEPSLPVEAVYSFGVAEESFRWTWPEIGAPVAAMPATVGEDGLPEPLQPPIMRAAAVVPRTSSLVTVLCMNLSFVGWCCRQVFSGAAWVATGVTTKKAGSPDIW